MSVVFTPDDGSLATFTLGRNFDAGDPLDDDPGQIVGLTDGTKVFVHKRGIRTHRREFRISSLEQPALLGLLAYVDDVLDGAKEVFTLTHEEGENLLAASDDLSSWTTSGTATVATGLTTAGPYGPNITCDRVTYTGGSGGFIFLDDTISQEIVNVTPMARLSFQAKIDSGDDWTPQVSGLSASSQTLGLVPADGTWHHRSGLFSIVSRDIGLMTEHATDEPAVFLRHVHLHRGTSERPFVKRPATTFTKARLIDGGVSYVQSGTDGYYDVSFAILQEFDPP